ncbi:MAG: class I SAM-dependent methyltransferase [Paracoccaceae bacterium]|nr:class I SAM-dependent methyltransferase [Paracoccaceae bacterium]
MDLELLIDLHKGGERQGPGSAELTSRALNMASLTEGTRRLQILDVGVGTGASTLQLAKSLDAEILAIDLSTIFLQILEEKAQSQGLSEQISTRSCSMDDLPFAEDSFDVVWAEGSIYNMGFSNGIEYLKRFLKPGGIMAVSEVIWLTKDRPIEIDDFWQNEYPEIATPSRKIEILEKQGFVLKGYFPFPKSAWWDNYYQPLQDRIDGFLSRHKSEAAKELIKAVNMEMELYEKYCGYYSYSFFVVQKF